MKTPDDVLLNGSRHLIVLGQLGNLKAMIQELTRVLEEHGQDEYLPLVKTIDDELIYLSRVYPRLDGAVVPMSEPPPQLDVNHAFAKALLFSDKLAVRNALRDIRALADAMNMSYVHEGTIACHLKVMFDESWGEAASAVGLDVLANIPS